MYIYTNVCIYIYVYRFRLNLQMYPVDFTSRLHSFSNSIYRQFCYIYHNIYVYRYLYICVYIYMNIYKCIYIYLYIYICIQVQAQFVDLSSRFYQQAPQFQQQYIQIVLLYIPLYISIYKYAYMYIYIHEYIYKLIYIYICIQAQAQLLDLSSRFYEQAPQFQQSYIQIVLLNITVYICKQISVYMCIYIHVYIYKCIYIYIYVYRFRLNLQMYPVDFTSRLRNFSNSIYRQFCYIYHYIYVYSGIYNKTIYIYYC